MKKLLLFLFICLLEFSLLAMEVPEASEKMVISNNDIKKQRLMKLKIYINQYIVGEKRNYSVNEIMEEAERFYTENTGEFLNLPTNKALYSKVASRMDKKRDKIAIDFIMYAKTVDLESPYYSKDELLSEIEGYIKNGGTILDSAYSELYESIVDTILTKKIVEAGQELSGLQKEVKEMKAKNGFIKLMYGFSDNDQLENINEDLLDFPPVPLLDLPSVPLKKSKNVSKRIIESNKSKKE